ncbi:MAG: glycoside hydrolase family 3 C-terminal domain-containing protein [Caulobacteraceae bacterium]
MCRLILRTGVLDGGPPQAGELRTARHRRIAEDAAVEAVVLLKNEGDLLPLEPATLKRLAVVGPNAAARRIQGGGSSQVRTDRRVSILSALTDRLAGRAEVLHADGGDNEPVPPAARPGMFSPDEARGQAGVLCEYFASADLGAQPLASRQERALGKLVSHDLGGGQPASYGAFRWSGWFWPERDGPSRVLAARTGRDAPVAGQRGADRRAHPGQAGQTRPRRPARAAQDGGGGPGGGARLSDPGRIRARLASRDDQAALGDGSEGWPGSTSAWVYASRAARSPAELAATCDAAVVVIGSASISEGEGYDRDDLDLPGDQNALVEAVLAANPRTVVVLNNGAPYVLPWIDHAPALVEAWMGGEAGPDAVARIILGEAEPSGRLPVTFPAALEDSPAQRFYPGGDTVTYGEGLRVGYRHFDAGAEPPLFPFGFGLTYTRFKYDDLHAPETVRVGESVTVSFSLKNVGERPGKETAQLYVRPRGPSGERPVKELKGFSKVALAPLEQRIVRIDLDARAFTFYDPPSGEWIAEPGAYDLLIGGSAADIELQATVRLEAPADQIEANIRQAPHEI